ncbi:MAG: polyphosphate kinase 1 [Fibromonadaceae bacterium]|jgi:polyphosphate kinase|nr:polyphosphate kinase 1 [Fibromonadaceae bacterium]
MNKFIKKTYINREYSWLKFNERVLGEAVCESNPLLERCKFLSIFTSNLDEFFMVRVGSLFNDLLNNPHVRENKTELTPAEQLNGIYKYTKKIYEFRARTAREIFVQLKKEKIKIENVRLENKVLSKRFEKYFQKTMLPLLNPIILDSKHPLIHLDNLKMYVMVHLEHGSKNFFGILPVPDKYEKLISDQAAAGVTIITIEELTYYFADKVFANHKVLSKSLVRLTRSADVDTEIFSVDYESEYDFSKLLKGKVASRQKLQTVRLELSGDCKVVKDFLCKHLNIAHYQCFTIKNFFDYKFLFSLDKYLPIEKLASLKYLPFNGRQIHLPKNNSIIKNVLANDLFLSYPFDSMDAFLDLLDSASTEKCVASIKITIYRLDKQSRIVEALRRASRNGKDVTAIIELAARFDEENNLHFAGILKEAGCTVIYGVGNYKVHSKIALIILKNGENISYITHLGTGNYNEGTSRVYTDLNIITADPEIGADAVNFFRCLSMGDLNFNCNKLLVSPKTLKEGLLQKIKEQTALAKAGKPAKIICKMNSLTDLDFIKEFIKASSAGVKVYLIVRGVCCLLPGVPGKTENIRVKSIVGRFLEHSRIYSFGNENSEIYISSADLMTRNTEKRVEIATPITDGKIRSKISKMLDIMLADNEKASYLAANGKYIKKSEPGESSQKYFMENMV